MSRNHGFGRRTFLGGLGMGVMSSYGPLLAAQTDTEEPLDHFIGRYMLAMNAPGMTLALADKEGVARTAGFGYSNVDLKTPVTPDLLFEIGSITKSFVGLTLLQMRDEGKVDFEKPILDYLPWVPIETNYGVVTVHHLLTHSSGLPDALALFLTDPQARHIQAFKPGEHFHYCNLGFSMLGYLIQKLDGSPWPEAVGRRILEPLGMTATWAVINDRTKAQRARSYTPYYTDSVYPRNGRLTAASDIVFDDAAGSITSTPGDMGKYLQMLLNRGQYSKGKIVSEEAFSAFSKGYIAAPEFSPTAFYGYGIGVDKLDGHAILRHTGGMVSFASSIHVDLDGGVAAFASINAMQGYRPIPVTEFAVQLMNAKAQNKAAPKAPELLDQKVIANANDYVGSYSAASGRTLEVVADSSRLVIRMGSGTAGLERVNGDVFISVAPAWEKFPLIFGRSEGKVVELAHGSDWFTNANYSGPRTVSEAAELKAFIGFYQSGSAWSGSVRIVLRHGKLFADGATVLMPIGNALYRIGDEPFGADTLQFHYVVDGKAQLMKWNGEDFWRIDMD